MTALTLLADHGHGWFWFWPLVPLFWLLVFFLFFRFVFWRGGGRWGYRRGPDPREILAERYARGEISYEEYRERLGHLEAA
ncbi:MAG TPA: SHOCT domain-containing protein [Gaiellaceae bacterium]|nr:SHOCT domain-containing protein [Gaiellaceae bacterium]